MTTLSEYVRAGYGGELLENEPLSRHTSLRIGGPADLFALPADRTELQCLLEVLQAEKTPWLVVGGGYNLLVRDGGFRGVIISLKRFNSIVVGPNGSIKAESGARSIDLSRLAESHQLSGLEFLVGIPGTVGGAVRMNAGAHGGEIFDHITSIELLVDGNIQQYDKKTLNYGYRSLQLEANKIIIAANFLLEAGNREKISAEMASCLKKRQESQKVRFPNAGSFFKNPPGHAAWRLIDQAGMRGATVGAAQVSEEHTNFLVNRGNATAKDFLKLAATVKEQVFRNSSVQLEEEVRIVGED